MVASLFQPIACVTAPIARCFCLKAGASFSVQGCVGRWFLRPRSTRGDPVRRSLQPSFQPTIRVRASSSGSSCPSRSPPWRDQPTRHRTCSRNAGITSGRCSTQTALPLRLAAEVPRVESFGSGSAEPTLHRNRNRLRSSVAIAVHVNRSRGASKQPSNVAPLTPDARRSSTRPALRPRTRCQR